MFPAGNGRKSGGSQNTAAQLTGAPSSRPLLRLDTPTYVTAQSRARVPYHSHPSWSQFHRNYALHEAR